MAEFLTLVSGLSREVLLPAGRRWMMFVPMLLGVVIALVGNWTVAQPHDVFSFLEAVAPPVVVLIVSMLGERLLITTIKARHALRKQYQQALNDWKQATADPENSAQWRPAYANALREMIVTVNSKGTGSTRRKELIASLDRRSWVALVNREIQSDSWFTGIADVAHDQHGQPVPALETVHSASQLPTSAPVNPTQALPTIHPAPVMQTATTSQNGNGHSA